MSQRSLIKRYSVKAQLKFTNTKASTEPNDIINAKATLKNTKNLTTEMEATAAALYTAQKQQATALSLLCNRLSTAPTHNPEDKFSIFLNNMGRVWSNFEEINQMYLINMKDQFLDPLRQFNKEVIPKCQQTKVNLKAVKGKYDLKKKSENKILDSQRYKNINLQKMHKARSQTTVKLDELTAMRNEFKSAISDMQSQLKTKILSSLQQYMDSYKAYADIHSKNLQIQTQMMLKHQRVPTQYVGDLANIARKAILPSLDSDMHNHTGLAFNNWGKRAAIVKEGYFKKRGQVNKGYKRRWFKLFANRKLTYFTHSGPNGLLKGHVNLSRVLSMNKPMNGHLIDIRTTERMWRFQFGSIEDRDSWYDTIQQTCVEGKGVTMTETANKFGDMFEKDMETTEKNEIEAMEQKQNITSLSVAMSDFVSINIKFRVAVESIKIFGDKELMNEIYSMQMKCGEIVEGQYMNANVVLLTKFKFYISAKDVSEVVMGSPMSQQFYTHGYNLENEIDTTVDPTDFVAIKTKFRVAVQDMNVFVDKELESRNEEIKLEKDGTFEGEYLDTNAVFIEELKCFVSTMDVEDVSIDEYI